MDLSQLPLPATIGGPARAGSAAAAGQSTGQSTGREAQALEIAEQFEAMFLSQMLAPMFESLQTDGPFGGGSSEGIYRSLMVDEYGKSIANAGGLGIAEAIQREILKMQEI